MKNLVLALAVLCYSLVAHTSVIELKEELGLKVAEAVDTNRCQLYLVQHGSTKWSEIQRLQGWNDIRLSEKGRAHVEELAQQLASVRVSAIYSSPLKSTAETSEILAAQLHCPVFFEPDLRGEFHGAFEGFYKEQYESHPHFQFYNALSAEEEIFFPCGEGGESKADVVRRIFPILKQISEKHPGESVVVVTHGGLFKVFNYYLGNYSQEAGTVGIAHGEYMRIEGDASSLYLR